MNEIVAIALALLYPFRSRVSRVSQCDLEKFEVLKIIAEIQKFT